MEARRIEGWKVGVYEDRSYEDRRIKARRIEAKRIGGWKLKE